MAAAVILLWSGCLWSIARTLLWLVWAASPWKRLLVLVSLALAFSCAHKPRRQK